MEEIKYGRGFKLSNGEIEYIELSEKIEHSYNRDDAILHLKRKVDKYHHDTEKDLLPPYPLDAQDPEKESRMDVVKRWLKAVGKTLVLLLIMFVVGCIFACLPVWLKLTIAVTLILYMVYLFARKEK